MLMLQSPYILSDYLMAFCMGNLLKQLENPAVVWKPFREDFLLLQLAARVFGVTLSARQRWERWV